VSEAQPWQLKVMPSGSTAIPGWLDQVEGTYSDTTAAYAQLKESLSDLYAEGYLAASYDSISRHGDTLKVFLYRGRQYRWGRFDISIPEGEATDMIPVPENFPAERVLNLQRLNAYQEQVLARLENHGYPFASVQLSNIRNSASDTIDAVLSVQTGPQYSIDSILIKGDAPVDRSFLYPYLGMFPGMVYDESKIREIPQKVENLDFLRQIRDFELEFSGNRRVNVFLYLERAEGNQAEGAVGFLPSRRGKIRFTGRLDMQLMNIFRRGESLDVEWSNPERSTQELHLEVDVPYVLLKRAGLHGNFELFKKDTSYINRSLRIGIPFHLGPHSRIEVFGDFKASSLISESTTLPGRYENFRSTLYGLRYKQERLDYRLNPSDGWRVDLFMSAGKRKSARENGKQTSAELGLDASWYRPLFRSWVIRLGSQTRLRQAWAGKEPVAVRENGLFRFGGFGSLRGFDDNALRASAYSILTLEVKYLLSKNSNLYGFFDGAWYQMKTPLQRITDWPRGFGLGGHIDSGMGIFYVSYALGQQFNNPIDPGSARIHIGYVSKF
jgi:outer membrane protein assembly factor BamA